jgi:type 1 fimbriae regulatory protein FimB
MKRLLDAAKGDRYSSRDYLMLLVSYRHGLRVSELIDLRLKNIDLDTFRLFVRRKKGSLSTHYFFSKRYETKLGRSKWRD